MLLCPEAVPRYTSCNDWVVCDVSVPVPEPAAFEENRTYLWVMGCHFGGMFERIWHGGGRGEVRLRLCLVFEEVWNV